MQDLQNRLDIKKWLESENAKKDLCSTYDYCSYCDKTLVNPCALAYTLYQANKTKKNKKVILSFKQKLDLVKDPTREKFNLLIQEIKTLDIKSRICVKNVTLRYQKTLIGLITLTRNSLKIHLALDPTLYEDIQHLDYSDKKTYADCPFTIKLSSKKAINNSIFLLEQISQAISLK